MQQKCVFVGDNWRNVMAKQIKLGFRLTIIVE